MTENLPDKITPQKIAAKDRSAPLRVSGRLKVAIERLVWYGDKRADAAAAAAMTDHGLRSAMRKPHVLRHYRNELSALRETERARNLHALVDVRDARNGNAMARVASVRALEQIDAVEAARPQGDVQRPGIVIRIVQQPAEPRVVAPGEIGPGIKIIEHEPARADVGDNVG